MNVFLNVDQSKIMDFSSKHISFHHCGEKKVSTDL